MVATIRSPDTVGVPLVTVGEIVPIAVLLFLQAVSSGDAAWPVHFATPIRQSIRLLVPVTLTVPAVSVAVKTEKKIQSLTLPEEVLVRTQGVYVLPALSDTVMLAAAVAVKAPPLTTTRSPIAAVTPVTVCVRAPVVPLFVPSNVGPTHTN